MKRTGHKKVIGLAIGDRSLLAAEVVAGPRPEIRRLAELVYPEGITPNKPAELGAALATFLLGQQFTAKHAVVGIPARWLVTQTKEVPDADESTVANILRLQAEAEFSSELKDLVYDFAGSDPAAGAGASAGSGGGTGGETGNSVLLLATPRKYVEASVTLCEAAKLTPISVTASALVLADFTGRAVSRNALVLSVGASGSEMTAPRGAGQSFLRHLRSSVPEGPFVNELRRVVSTLPPSNATREMVLWDAGGMDANALGGQIGLKIRSGELSTLGVEASTLSKNGESRKFAAAVALALSGLDERALPVDFLHSRLAPPKAQLIPRWAVTAALALLVAIAAGIFAYQNLQTLQTKLDAAQAKLAAGKADRDAAQAFVSQVSFAQAWHGGDPRYLACMKDLTMAVSEDRDTYATGLIVHENVKNPGTGQTAAKPGEKRTLAGVLSGKTSDQEKVENLLDRMRHIKGFVEAKLGGSNASRGREVTFSIMFTYLPSKSAP